MAYHTYNVWYVLRFLTRKKTGKAGFAKLSLCIREETSRGGGGRFKGSLVEAVLLKPVDSDPL